MFISDLEAEIYRTLSEGVEKLVGPHNQLPSFLKLYMCKFTFENPVLRWFPAPCQLRSVDQVAGNQRNSVLEINPYYDINQSGTSLSQLKSDFLR